MEEPYTDRTFIGRGPGQFASLSNMEGAPASLQVTIKTIISIFALAGLAYVLYGLIITIRPLFCCCFRRRPPSPETTEKPRPAPAPCRNAPRASRTLSFSECAICLAEFAVGDLIRVLPACRHGFHVECIKRWFAVRRSCPTCRRSYGEVGRRAAILTGEPQQQREVEVNINS